MTAAADTTIVHGMDNMKNSLSVERRFGPQLYWLTVHLTEHYVCVFQLAPFFLLADPFWLRQITTDPDILADVNIMCPDDRQTKLKIYITKMILDSYEHISNNALHDFVLN